jgi:hypothetical protein
MATFILPVQNITTYSFTPFQIAHNNTSAKNNTADYRQGGGDKAGQWPSLPPKNLTQTLKE